MGDTFVLFSSSDRVKRFYKKKGYETVVEKRLVSFIYFIVDSKTFLLSVKSRDGCPYKYNSG